MFSATLAARPRPRLWRSRGPATGTGGRSAPWSSDQGTTREGHREALLVPEGHGEMEQLFTAQLHVDLLLQFPEPGLRAGVLKDAAARGGEDRRSGPRRSGAV